jgi:hypothetical protein
MAIESCGGTWHWNTPKKLICAVQPKSEPKKIPTHDAFAYKAENQCSSQSAIDFYSRRLNIVRILHK